MTGLNSSLAWPGAPWGAPLTSSHVVGGACGLLCVFNVPLSLYFTAVSRFSYYASNENMDGNHTQNGSTRCMQGGAFLGTPSRPPTCVAGPKLSRGARAPRASVAGRVATDGGLLLRGDDVVELLGGIGRGLRRRLAASHQHIGTAGRVAQHQHLRRESAMRVRRRVRGGGAWGGARRSVSAA